MQSTSSAKSDYASVRFRVAYNGKATHWLRAPPDRPFQTQLSLSGSSTAVVPGVNPSGTRSKPPLPNSAAQMNVGLDCDPWYTLRSSPDDETLRPLLMMTVPAGQSTDAVSVCCESEDDESKLPSDRISRSVTTRLCPGPIGARSRMATRSGESAWWPTITQSPACSGGGGGGDGGDEGGAGGDGGDGGAEGG